MASLSISRCPHAVKNCRICKSHRGSVAARSGPKRVLDLSHGGGTHGVDGQLFDFDYMFESIVDDPDSHLPVSSNTVNALNDLGDSMVEPAPSDDPPNNSPIPPIYTYWGQFVDHDLTANTDRDSTVSDITKDDLKPLDPDFVKEYLKNIRQPSLNLDSVYGDGPFAESDDVPYDGIKLKVGEVQTGRGIPGVMIPPIGDLFRDLPRRQEDGAALIGDGRNDENLVVAQLHVAFLRFHNAAVDWVRKNQPEKDDKQVFATSRDLTRWTYQWLVVHDFIKTVAIADVVDRVLASEKNLLNMDQRGTYMPLEFSVASYRFGHSMVRGAYDWNRNFGRPGNAFQSIATFDQLFQFTGKADPATRFGGGGTRLPFNWIAEWDRMVDKDSLLSNRFARRIDTVLAPPLAELLNEGNDPNLAHFIKALLKQLARRNLLRGYLLSLPTGQAVAKELGLDPLTEEELKKNTDKTNRALDKGGFVNKTPLWFYVLKESEVREQGNCLGEVGSHIVSETIIGHIKHDLDSYLNQNDWTPDKGVRLQDGSPVSSIKDFLRFAGVLE